MKSPRKALVDAMTIAERAESDDEEFHREDGELLARFILKFGKWLLESGHLPEEPKVDDVEKPS